MADLAPKNQISWKTAEKWQFPISDFRSTFEEKRAKRTLKDL